MAAATLLTAALLLPLGAVAQPSGWGEPPAAGGSRDAFSPPETMKPAEMTTPDYCQQLAQESVGVKAPLVLGKKGAVYVGGQDLPGQGASNIWPVSEPETVGFTHAFHHDGRARGEAIVTDTLTNAASDLVHFFIVFALVRACFSAVGFLAFGSYHSEHFYAPWQELLLTAMGNQNIKELRGTNDEATCKSKATTPVFYSRVCGSSTSPPASLKNHFLINDR
jgi:hypothetical protein